MYNYLLKVYFFNAQELIAGGGDEVMTEKKFKRFWGNFYALFLEIDQDDGMLT